MRRGDCTRDRARRRRGAGEPGGIRDWQRGSPSGGRAHRFQELTFDRTKPTASPADARRTRAQGGSASRRRPISGGLADHHWDRAHRYAARLNMLKGVASDPATRYHGGRGGHRGQTLTKNGIVLVSQCPRGGALDSATHPSWPEPVKIAFQSIVRPDQAATGQLLTELAEDMVSRYGHDVTVVDGRHERGGRDREGGRRLNGRETQEASTSTGTARRCAGPVVARAPTTATTSRRDGGQLRRRSPDVVVSLTAPDLASPRCGRATHRGALRRSLGGISRGGTLIETFRAPRDASLDRVTVPAPPLTRSRAIGAARRRLSGEAPIRRGSTSSKRADCDKVLPGQRKCVARANGLSIAVVMHSGRRPVQNLRC